MTDFIMTMLMITLLNVLFGSVAFITLMFFIKKSEEKKKSKVASELINGRIINIREYSMSMKDYLHIVEITPVISMPVISIIEKSIIETEAIPVYAKAKSKHGFSGSRQRLTRMKVRGNRHNATDSTLPDILVRNYQQTINDSGAHNAQFEFHRLTVPCG
ncbi:TPA: hypothetical protein RUX58_004018 [Aeromonas dhakensis]|nr:hypothetical protein [Aeromonas dhakensis]